MHYIYTQFINLYHAMNSFFMCISTIYIKFEIEIVHLKNSLIVFCLMDDKFIFSIILCYCMNTIRITSITPFCCLMHSIFFHSNLNLLIDIIFIIAAIFMIFNHACNHVICNHLLFICALPFFQ